MTTTIIIKADPGWEVIGENYAPDDAVDHPGFWRQTIIAWEITRELTPGKRAPREHSRGPHHGGWGTSVSGICHH